MLKWLYIFEQIDEHVSNQITRTWRRSFAFDAAMIVIAKWTPIFMLLVIVVASTGIGLMGLSRDAAILHAGISVVAAVFARVLNEPMSRWLDRPRPFETLGISPLLDHDAGKAFPSNHATGAFALAIGMYGIPLYFPLMLLMAIFLSFSRIYNGLHHLTDVLAGFMNGSLVSIILLWTLSHLGYVVG
jgi:undecaprenyl-diphosphatase